MDCGSVPCRHKTVFGAGHASPASVSGPELSLLGQDFVGILGSLHGTHPLHCGLSNRLAPLPLLRVVRSGRQRQDVGTTGVIPDFKVKDDPLLASRPSLILDLLSSFTSLGPRAILGPAVSPYGTWARSFPSLLAQSPGGSKRRPA